MQVRHLIWVVIFTILSHALCLYDRHVVLKQTFFYDSHSAIIDINYIFVGLKQMQEWVMTWHSMSHTHYNSCSFQMLALL